MDLSKLSSQLVKEAEKNPVKAGALGLLTLVALWFWAPLVWGWIRPADNVTPEAALVSTSTAATPTTAAPTAGAAPISFDWQSLLQARRSDPKMAIAGWKVSARDPFREVVVKPAAPVEKPVEQVVSTAPPAKGLSELGLVLQGVMLGEKAKSATINGFMLPEGAEFAVDRDGKILRRADSAASDTTITRIEVREIRAAGVVLVSEGKEFVLPLRRRTASSGTIEITRAAAGK